MWQNLISRKFFKENPLKEISSQRLVYMLVSNEGLEQLASQVARDYLNLSPARLVSVDQERAMLSMLQDPVEIFQLMRKSIDGLNRTFLIDKALEFEDDLYPLVIEKLIRSNHDTFIDNAIRFLGACKTNCSDVFERRYSEIRSPYVQSLICILLGLKANERIISWMLERFYELKRLFPEENYDQGPLVAMHELKRRFPN
jgi:hypothetical protein